MAGRKREKRGFEAFCFVFAIVCFLIVMAVHDPGQAAPPAAGIEKHQQAGLTCQSCHKESPPNVTVAGAQCMTCHGDVAKLIAKSIKAVPNPHASPHISPGETPKCEECHHIHKPSEISCNNCHQDFKFKMP